MTTQINEVILEEIKQAALKEGLNVLDTQLLMILSDYYGIITEIVKDTKLDQIKEIKEKRDKSIEYIKLVCNEHLR